MGHYVYDIDEQFVIVPVIIAHPGGDADYSILPQKFVIEEGVMSGKAKLSDEIKNLPGSCLGGHQYKRCFGTKKFDTDDSCAFPSFVFMPREYTIDEYRFYPRLKTSSCSICSLLFITYIRGCRGRHNRRGAQLLPAEQVSAQLLSFEGLKDCTGVSCTECIYSALRCYTLSNRHPSFLGFQGKPQSSSSRLFLLSSFYFFAFS